ncbi:hypothetical protein [Mycolicibacterium arenosum]|uniref:Uncharacterized protein n=1 Tax=Mycolicibacterium arenosum TaxID=2952157 RepID=A0ABT1M253_9MYCO|nr:hypothetical protein [Mycolicibacterium sp. CAU 1645]MCP9273186.1 hypothetical protein [Mycolicibacterium sp. CAU 1645]
MSNVTKPDDPGGAAAVDKAKDAGVDPHDTDHPTGSQQAAENAADESPS